MESISSRLCEWCEVMDSELRQELADIKAQLANMTDRLDNQVRTYISNESAQNLLERSPEWFSKKIKDGTFIKGLHFTGDRTSRYWRRSRLLRWIETQDDPDQQLKDQKKWFRESK